MRLSQRVAMLLATWFGCGYAPIAPGTAGSLGALTVALVLWRWLEWGPLYYGVLALLFLLPAVWSAGVAARVTNQKDPGLVVIDEVVGQWVTLAGASHLNWKSWIAAFILFRVLDIWKPAPVRQLEALPAGTGIVADDVMAGLYGALVLWLAGWLHLY